jgi:betaine reductase
LAETQLGLEVYHVLEDEIRMQIPPDVFEEQIGVMVDVLDATGLAEAVAAMRAKRP